LTILRTYLLFRNLQFLTVKSQQLADVILLLEQIRTVSGYCIIVSENFSS